MASKLLDKYINEMRKGTPDSVVMDGDEKKASAGDKLARYKECAEKNGVFEVYFSYANSAGDLIAQDNKGVKIEFLAKDIKQDINYYSPYYKDRFLNRPLVVRIIGIDEETGIIRVRSGRSIGYPIKRRLINEIEKEMEKLKNPEEKPAPKKTSRKSAKSAEEPAVESKEEFLEVVGRVESVTPQRAIVNILGKGILGFCYARNWQKNYTRDMTDSCHEGYVYDFQVIGKLPSRKGHEQGFNLSHAAFTQDAWEHIPAELFEENAVLIVECVERPMGKNYWWGKADIAPGLEIQGDYNSNIGTLRESVAYKCKIKHLDVEKRQCRVVPFAVAEKDRDKVDSIRFIELKKKKNRA